MNRPPISVYIPTRNAERHVTRCIESVLAQSYQPDEILVVDGHSTDKTVELARRYPVRIVEQGMTPGIAAARNVGLRSARNDLVASLDADCVAKADWLERLWAGFDTEKVAMGGGAFIESVQRTSADRFRKIHVRRKRPPYFTRNPHIVTGSNTLARRDAVAAVGWYDERFQSTYEDTDISDRLRAHGYGLFYDPLAVVHHMKEDDDQSVLRSLWSYNRLGYRRKVSLLNVLVRIVQNSVVALRWLRSDLGTEEWGVIRLDVLATVQFARWDWRLWRGISRVQGNPEPSADIR